MARCKETARKMIGPKGVPRRQLAPRDDPGEGSRNPNTDPQAEIARLTAELRNANEDRANWRRWNAYNRRLRDEAWEREDAAAERIEELEHFVEHVEQHNDELLRDLQSLENLVNPEYQRQAAQDDLGIVMGADDEEEHPRENIPEENRDEDMEGGNVVNPELVLEESEEEDPEMIEEYEEEEEEEDMVPVDSDDEANMHLDASDDDG